MGGAEGTRRRYYVFVRKLHVHNPKDYNFCCRGGAQLSFLPHTFSILDDDS